MIAGLALRCKAYGPSARLLRVLHELDGWHLLPRRTLRQAFRMVVSRRSSSSQIAGFLVEQVSALHGIGPIANYILASCLIFAHAETPLCRLFLWLGKERENSQSSPGLGDFCPARTAAKPLLPAHLPLAPAQVQEAPPYGRRPRAAFFARRAAWIFCEWTLALFGFYEGGGPKSPTQYRQLFGPYISTEEQRGAVFRLYEGSIALCRLRVDDPLTRGRATLAQSLAALSDLNVGSSTLAKSVGARDVVVDRISIPRHAGTCDPQQFLQDKYLDAYVRIDSLVLPVSEWLNPLPKPCLMIDPSQEQLLRRRLVESGMAVLLEESLVPRGPTGRKLLAGVFCVEHKRDRDRLIIDRRPQNGTEGRLNWAALPHGAMLARLRLGPDETLRGTVLDLSNYFYNLRCPESWIRRNAFGRAFTGSEARELGGCETKKYHLALCVWPMGDHNAVDVAQKVHESVLDRGGALHHPGWLYYGGPIPRSKLLQGVYVDDHLILSIGPRERQLVPEGPDVDLLAASLAAYEGANLPVADEKGARFAGRFTVWGTEVDSRSGCVGAPASRRLQLLHLTFARMTARVSSPEVLRSLVGSIIHPFMHRREWSSVLGRVFRFIDAAPVGKALQIPAHIRDEIRGCALGLIHACGNVRAQVSSRIHASDATPSAAACVSADVSQDLAETLYDFADSKGKYVRLDGGPFESLLSRWRGRELPQYLSDAIASARWVGGSSCSFKSSAHVNLQELKGLKMVIKHEEGSISRIPRRLVSLSDSQVVVGSYSKGRSSSARLNNILRSMLGWTCLKNLEVVLCWIPTDKNVADEPSRGKPLRPAQVPTSPLVARLVTPSGGGRNRGGHRRRVGLFLEVFSGAGGLTRAMKKIGIATGDPYEAFRRKGEHRREHDLLVDSTFEHLLQAVRNKTYHYVHFGLPCSTWSAWQRPNPNSTRSTQRPEGAGPSLVECLANCLTDRVLLLCREAERVGCFWSIENPKSSLVWRYPPMLETVEGKYAVDFDQCMYGLEVAALPVRKPTRVVTNLQMLLGLQLVCSKQHQHRRCGGKVRTSEGSANVSQLAGVYPELLCERWALLYNDYLRGTSGLTFGAP